MVNFLAVPGASGLAGVVGQRAAQESGETSVRSVQGLARLEGDRLAMQSADDKSDLNALVSHSQIVAPEINLLQFEYHDGTAWVASWDSVGMGRLPQAIRVTLGFRPPQKPAASQSLRGVQDPSSEGESVGIVRKVIPLSTADPTAGLGDLP